MRNETNYWVMNKFAGVFVIIAASSPKEAAVKAVDKCREELCINQSNDGETFLIVLPIEGDEPQFQVAPRLTWTVY